MNKNRFIILGHTRFRHHTNHYVHIAYELRLKGIDVTYFRVPDDEWEALGNDEERWEVNRAFLHNALFVDGRTPLRATSAIRASLNSFFERELAELSLLGINFIELIRVDEEYYLPDEL